MEATMTFSIAENHTPVVENENGIVWISVDEIHPDPNQPRKNKPQEHFESLAMSIASEGLHNMPHVVESDEISDYMLVNGECRYTACALFLAKHVETDGDFVLGHVRRVNGEIQIKCEVKRFESDSKRKVNQILDNASRKNFDPLEELQAISELIDAGMAIPDIAKALGRSVTVIEADLPILKLPQALLKLYDQGTIAKQVARRISEFPNEKAMTNAWTNYASKVRGVENQLAKIEAYQRARDKKKVQLFDLKKADPQEVKDAKHAYRKLKAACNAVVDKNLLSDTRNLMVAANSKELEKVDEIAKTLTKIGALLHEGVVTLKAGRR
jgi:ParB-like chromosome segregation protein Spo0J